MVLYSARKFLLPFFVWPKRLFSSGRMWEEAGFRAIACLRKDVAVLKLDSDGDFVAGRAKILMPVPRLTKFNCCVLWGV